jgi:hypothetical protein
MQNKKTLATILFVVVVGGVVGLFTYLGGQGGAPPMPASKGPQHQLRLNLKGDLIGVESDPPVDPLQASGGAGFVYDKKAVEKRVNEGCAQCHGAAGMDLASHPCRSNGAGCIPDHHPPKAECIKCHRTGR